MFYPIELKIENFMGIREGHIDFSAFNSCLIIGKNKNNHRKSNGVGKSTIFKAITFVCFGEYPGKHIDEIVLEGCDKCQVSFIFKTDIGIFKVTRIRNITSGKTEVKLEEKAEDKWVSKEQRTSKQASEELSKLLKINFSSFNNSVFFSQGDLTGLASVTPDKKKELLKEPLQLAIYSKYERCAKEKIKKLEEKYQVIGTQLLTLGDPNKDISTYSNKLKSLTEEISLLQTQEDDKKTELSESKNKLSDVRNKLTKLVSDLEIRLEKIISSKDLKKNLLDKTNISLNSISNDIKNSNTLKDNSIKELESLKEELNELNKKELDSAEKIEKKIGELQDKEQKGKAYLLKLKEDLNKCEHVLPEDGECPECKQTICDDYRDKFIKDNNNKKEDIKENYKIYSEKLDKICNSISNLKITLKEIISVDKKKDDIQKNISINENSLSSLIKYIEKLNDMQKNSQDTKKSLEKEIKELIKEETDINKQIEKLNFKDLQEKEKQLILDINKLNVEVNTLSTLLSNKNREIGNTEALIDQCKESIRKINVLSKNKKELEKELKVKRRGVFAFNPKGIPTLIINTILDDLQIESNKLLQELRPELATRFIIEKDNKDTLDIIFTVNGKERSYYLLSGGQQTYIALAFKMGLSIVIQKRLGVDLKLLGLDEVDQPLDEDGVDAYADVIKKWQDKFKILVTTHNKNLQDKFEHVILVEQEDGGATARMIH